MTFKFSAGQAVEYTPRGGTLGLFTVLRRMPEEFQAYDRKYRIRNQQGVEWSVLECDLSASDTCLEEYRLPAPRMRQTSKY